MSEEAEIKLAETEAFEQGGYCYKHNRHVHIIFREGFLKGKEHAEAYADETNKELKKGINELEKEVLRGINEFDAVKYKWPKMETKEVIKIMERMLENYVKPLNN